MHVLLLSTYELGRQPFGLASPAAWLRASGCTVTSVDLSRTTLQQADVGAADLVAWYLPMHTATRLAVPVIRRVRQWNPRAHLCAYGLYAPLNAPLLGELGIGTVLDGEFEADLTALAMRLRAGAADPARPPDRPAAADSVAASRRDDAAIGPVPAGGRRGLPRLAFHVPDRRGLPPLDRYAALQVGPGASRIVGYTEASRGCRHFCRHCPIVPVYGGQFRIVPHDVVLADIRQQVAAGARHITFGDPDFFNGIGHAVRLVQRFARECPGVTYDVTIKIEHLLAHAAHLATLRGTGCLFVTSAVESIDDDVLDKLAKGHTRADFEHAVARCRDVGLGLSPTFVSFTPWTNLEGYCDLLDAIERLDLVEHVSPVQLAIRLLIPEGSRLLERADVRALVGPFDMATLTYRWQHRDPRVDALQRRIGDLVGVRLQAPREETFDAVRRLAYLEAGRTGPLPSRAPIRPRATVPYLNEPWYC